MLIFLTLAMAAPDALPKDEEIAPVLEKLMGQPVKIEAFTANHAFTADFNRDGRLDLAVFVDLVPIKSKLVEKGVKFLDVDPWSKSNGKQIDPERTIQPNCVGVMILHGGAKGWTVPTATYAFFECMSGMKVAKKSLLLDLESGALIRVSWNGKTYRGSQVREGD